MGHIGYQLGEGMEGSECGAGRVQGVGQRVLGVGQKVSGCGTGLLPA